HPPVCPASGRAAAASGGGSALGARRDRRRRGARRGHRRVPLRTRRARLIFVDTSFWVGVAMPRDDRHREARRLFEHHAGSTLVTTNHVRGETWTLLRRRSGHRVAVAFLDSLERTRRLRIELVSEALEREALDWLRR